MDISLFLSTFLTQKDEENIRQAIKDIDPRVQLRQEGLVGDAFVICMRLNLWKEDLEDYFSKRTSDFIKDRIKKNVPVFLAYKSSSGIIQFYKVVLMQSGSELLSGVPSSYGILPSLIKKYHTNPTEQILAYPTTPEECFDPKLLLLLK